MTLNIDGEYALTLRQYEQRERERCVADYGIDGAEYDRYYPRGSRKAQWLQDVTRAARDGNPPSRYVERSLLREFGERTITHLRLDVEQARSYA